MHALDGQGQSGDFRFFFIVTGMGRRLGHECSLFAVRKGSIPSTINNFFCELQPDAQDIVSDPVMGKTGKFFPMRPDLLFQADHGQFHAMILVNGITVAR
jgi:hypothetical protein